MFGVGDETPMDIRGWDPLKLQRAAGPLPKWSDQDLEAFAKVDPVNAANLSTMRTGFQIQAACGVGTAAGTAAYAMRYSKHPAGAGLMGFAGLLSGYFVGGLIPNLGLGLYKVRCFPHVLVVTSWRSYLLHFARALCPDRTRNMRKQSTYPRQECSPTSKHQRVLPVHQNITCTHTLCGLILDLPRHQPVTCDHQFMAQDCVHNISR